MVGLEPVVPDGHNAPSVGSSEIQYDIGAPPVAARVDGAGDRLRLVVGGAALPGSEPERHQYRIETGDNLPDRDVALFTVSEQGHVVIMVDHGRVLLRPGRLPSSRPEASAPGAAPARHGLIGKVLR